MRNMILNQDALPAGEAGITRHGETGAELVRRGHDVTVIASNLDCLTRQPTARAGVVGSTTHDGVRFIWARTGARVANDRRRVARMLRCGAVATWAGLRSRPTPDVVVGSLPQPLAILAASVLARAPRRPRVFEARYEALLASLISERRRKTGAARR